MRTFHHRSRTRSRSNGFIMTIGLIFLVVLCYLATWGCRNWEIDRCINNGGDPHVPSWFSEEPHNVLCEYEQP